MMTGFFLFHDGSVARPNSFFQWSFSTKTQMVEDTHCIAAITKIVEVAGWFEMGEVGEGSASAELFLPDRGLLRAVWQ